MYFTECFVFRNFRLFLHRCEPHVRPWLLDMRLATVCMSMYGPVYSICTQKPKPIWAWNAVNCEPVVACGFRMGYANLCCSAVCCVAKLIDHLHLAWLCNCVCCIQGNTFLYVFHRMLRVSEFQVVPAPL